MRRVVLSLVLCYLVVVFFSPFSIALTSLGRGGGGGGGWLERGVGSSL